MTTKVEFTLDDGSPTDSKERLEYVGRVAGFFADIMRKKVQHMISEQYLALANPINTREQDLIIKANINALSLLLDWGDESEAEHQSLLAEIRES